MQDAFVGLIVPKGFTKDVKCSLEAAQLYNSRSKIRPLKNDELGNQCCIVPTSIIIKDGASGGTSFFEEYQKRIINVLSRNGAAHIVKLVTFTTLSLTDQPAFHLKNETTNHKAFRKAIECIESISKDLSIPDTGDLLLTLPHSYCIYTPFLLLSSKFYELTPWKSLFDKLEESVEAKRAFFTTLTQGMNVTHVAVDAPIPAKLPPMSSSLKEGTVTENIVRSPYNIKPLWGEFGPRLLHFPNYTPTSKDFDQALWVSTYQNGIFQCWAPLYTMFSSGNVTEKARILNSDSVRSAVQDGETDGRGCCAIDLFAGIGYFAFSYAKAGVSKVLCWDINPWSVEGLRRGSILNKWPTKAVESLDDLNLELRENQDTAKILVFSESNIHASARIRNLRHLLPPVRHVNCGMLPTSDSAWKTAIEAIDDLLGGWLHVHETAFQNNIDSRAKEVLTSVQGHLNAIQGDGDKVEASLANIAKVKSVGPRLLHIVLDIWIPPRAGSVTLCPFSQD